MTLTEDPTWTKPPPCVLFAILRSLSISIDAAAIASEESVHQNLKKNLVNRFFLQLKENEVFVRI